MFREFLHSLHSVYILLMDLDIIYTSLVADKMSRENWGGCGCSSAWIGIVLLLYLGGYGSYKVYEWADDKFVSMVMIGENALWATIIRIAIVCGIVLFWVLLFALTWYLEGRGKK